jgi:hypothetical protein
MSLLPTVTTTHTKTTAVISIAQAFTEIATRNTTSTHTISSIWNVAKTSIGNPTSTGTSSLGSSYATDHVVFGELVSIGILVEVPLTCENIYGYSARCRNTARAYRGTDREWLFNNDDVFYSWPQFVGPSPNPDIAGIGVSIPWFWGHKLAVLTCEKIMLAFFITACSVVLLALAAYAGGFLPAHFLRRVDKRVFRANSRNQHSRWRDIIESVMMSLSDQQLVTGFAILIAGYYEMMNSNLAMYHWRIVTYLAWLSSSVHIASLTLLRDVSNKNPTFRNIRVAGMLLLLILLSVSLWPTRFETDSEPSYLGLPAKCYWTSAHATPFAGTEALDSNWLISMVMLLFAYAWKLSQLFASSRGFVRQWLVAKPEAAIERLMRRAVTSDRPKWLIWPLYKGLTVCYVSLVVYAEFAESFVVSIIYLCVTLPYGITIIVNTRMIVGDDVIAGERRLTFGQLVPLFLLVLPILMIFELSSGPWMFPFRIIYRSYILT